MMVFEVRSVYRFFGASLPGVAAASARVRKDVAPIRSRLPLAGHVLRLVRLSLRQVGEFHRVGLQFSQFPLAVGFRHEFLIIHADRPILLVLPR